MQEDIKITIENKKSHLDFRHEAPFERMFEEIRTLWNWRFTLETNQQEEELVISAYKIYYRHFNCQIWWQQKITL